MFELCLVSITSSSLLILTLWKSSSRETIWETLINIVENLVSSLKCFLGCFLKDVNSISASTTVNGLDLCHVGLTTHSKQKHGDVLKYWWSSIYSTKSLTCPKYLVCLHAVARIDRQKLLKVWICNWIVFQLPWAPSVWHNVVTRSIPYKLSFNWVFSVKRKRHYAEIESN